MNIKNPQQGDGRGGGGDSELTLVPSIPKVTDFDSIRIHIYLVRDRVNLNENMSFEIARNVAAIFFEFGCRKHNYFGAIHRKYC